MIGIDGKIEQCRTLFEQNLFTDYDFDWFGRAFLNERDGNVIPEIWNTDTNKYQEVLLDTKKAGTAFFIVGDYDGGTLLTAPVTMYISVNLETLYSSVSERALEYLHKDLLHVLRAVPFHGVKIVPGREAYSDFKVKDTDDMQPFYLMKITMEATWERLEQVKQLPPALSTEDGRFIVLENSSLIILA